jgi:hypothetical protein
MNTPVACLSPSVSRTHTPHKDKAAPEWSRAGYIDKLAQAYVAIEELGGKIFTLRFSQDQHDRFLATPDPCRAFYKRLEKSFRRFHLEDPLCAFFLEVTPDDRNQLHVHGALTLGNSRLDQVKAALRHAGGVISGPAAARQVHVMDFDFNRGGPEGWARYPKKAVTRTRRVIRNNKVTYINSALRRISRDKWEQKRSRRTSMTA